MLLDKDRLEYRKYINPLPEWTPEEKRYAALLVYLKWSYIGRFGYEPEDLADRFRDLGIQINRFESNCAWCSLYRVGRGAFQRRKCSNQCPLDRIGQNCFMTMSWFNCVSLEDDYKRNGDNFEDYMTGKEAAGNIAALAWKEYKRLGG